MLTATISDTLLHASSCISELNGSTLTRERMTEQIPLQIVAVESSKETAGGGGGRSRGNEAAMDGGWGWGCGGQGAAIYSQNSRRQLNNGGIDITTDLSLSYSLAEWRKLHHSIRAYIQTARSTQQSDPLQESSNEWNVSSAVTKPVQQEDAQDHKQHASGNGNYFGSWAYLPPSKKRPPKWWSDDGK